MTAKPRSVLLALVLVGMAETGRAQNARATEDDTMVSAEDLFRQGVAAYDASDYERAIELFRKAYGRAHEPAILFNIARAYRALGDCAKALHNLDSFLEVAAPQDPLVVRAHANRKEIDECLEEQRRTKPSPAPGPEAHSGVTQLGAAPSPAPRPVARIDLKASSLRTDTNRGASTATTLCHATIGSTITLALGEIVLLFYTHRLAARVDAATAWNDDLQRADDQQAVLGTASEFTAGALAVAAATAAGVCWVHWHEVHASDDTR